MTREQRLVYRARVLSMQDAELRSTVKRELDIYQQLKQDRAPDLSEAIDRCTILVEEFQRRHKAAVVHRDWLATVDAGELWINTIGPIRKKALLSLNRVVDTDDRLYVGSIHVERMAEFRRKANTIRAAAERIKARGLTLTYAELAHQARTDAIEVQRVVRRLREHGEWPEDWTFSQVERKALSKAPIIPVVPDGMDASILYQWVDLAPELPGYEGTLIGRCKRVGKDRVLRPSDSGYCLSLPSGRKTSVSEIKIARMVAQRLKVPVPHGVDRRQSRHKVDPFDPSQTKHAS